MRPAVWLALCAIGFAQSREAPAYSSASIVNAASNEPGPVAPYSIISIYGKNLAYVTRALTPADVRSGVLPIVLPNTGVRVFIANIPAAILFVSPGQINALVPANLRPGPVELQVGLDALYGPAVAIEIAENAPALFMTDTETPIAVRLDGRVATRNEPLRPGEWIALYATGLGKAVPAQMGVELATGVARLEKIFDFEVRLNGEAVPMTRVGYAGLAPGFAGLYQINVQIPEDAPPDPELRLGIRGSPLSRAGLRIPLR